MIGSNTLIVKKGKNLFDVYRIGFSCKPESVITKKPNLEGISEQDAFIIANSHQCASPFGKNYSDFAGDNIEIIELENGKISAIDRNEFCAEFVAKNPHFLSNQKSKLNRKIKQKRKEIISFYEKLESIFNNWVLSGANRDFRNELIHILYYKTSETFNIFPYHKFDNADLRYLKIPSFSLWLIQKQKSHKSFITSKDCSAGTHLVCGSFLVRKQKFSYVYSFHSLTFYKQ